MSNYWMAEVGSRRVLVVAVDVGRREVVVTDLNGPAWVEELRHVRFVVTATAVSAVTHWLAPNPAREIE